MEQINMGAKMPEEKKSIGPVMSIIVIVVVIALGAYYFLNQVPVEEGIGRLLTPAEMQADPTISKLSSQGTSTDLSDIQKDLDATDLSNLDAGL